MPRRTPGELRALLPRRDPRYARRTVIRGLSAATNGQIARFERRHHLPQGDIALAFRRWRYCAFRPRGVEAWRPDADVSTEHVRAELEAVLHGLTPRARRELQAALAPIDAHVLSRTVNDPLAPTHLPWWQRRIEI